jgi:hypothetical protein
MYSTYVCMSCTYVHFIHICFISMLHLLSYLCGGGKYFMPATEVLNAGWMMHCPAKSKQFFYKLNCTKKNADLSYSMCYVCKQNYVHTLSIL